MFLLLPKSLTSYDNITNVLLEVREGVFPCVLTFPQSSSRIVSTIAHNNIMLQQVRGLRIKTGLILKIQSGKYL